MKRIISAILTLMLCFGLIGCGNLSTSNTDGKSDNSSSITDSKSDNPSTITDSNESYSSETSEPAPSGSSLTMGQKNALRSAQSYLRYSDFSYTGLISQLEYEGYSTEDATFAADNCGADWTEQAAKSAKEYLDYSSFSRDGLIDQLEYEGFTHDQAVYGVEQNGY